MLNLSTNLDMVWKNQASLVFPDHVSISQQVYASPSDDFSQSDDEKIVIESSDCSACFDWRVPSNYGEGVM